MSAVNKVGTQLLVSPAVRDTARALALVRRESVAEIWRLLAEPALDDAAGRDDSLADVYRTVFAPAFAEMAEVDSKSGQEMRVGRAALYARAFDRLVEEFPDQETLFRTVLKPAIEKWLANTPPVAEVYRTELEPALEKLKERSAHSVNALYAALDSMFVDRSRAMEAMLQQKIRFADLFEDDGSHKDFFPGVI